MDLQTPDGPGRLVGAETQHGTTFLHVEGDFFDGWYSLQTVSGFEDHSDEFLSQLPKSGVELPYDPAPRFVNPGEATIEPIHELKPNMDSTNSTKNLRSFPDPMAVFPTDTQRTVTPYHSSSLTAALRSLSDIVNPEEDNATRSPEEGDTQDAHEFHVPFSDDPFLNDFQGDISDNNGGVMSDPTTEHELSPSTSFWAHRSADFRGGVRKPRLHFDSDFSENDVSQHWDQIGSPADLDQPFQKSEDAEQREGESDAEVNPKESSFDFLGTKCDSSTDCSADTHRASCPMSQVNDWEGAIDSETGRRLPTTPGQPWSPAKHKAKEENTPPEFAQYIVKLEKNSQFREAKWQDVRNKAIRLRRDGAVNVVNFNPYGCIARVEGDSGTYDTEINRNNAFGKTVTWWDCNCLWGKWAYKRVRDYVGRMCSHAYATYMEMQALDTKKKRDPFGITSGVEETPQGFMVFRPGGQQQGPFPTRPAAEQAEEELKAQNKTLGAYRFNDPSDGYSVGDVVGVIQHGTAYDAGTDKSVSLVPGDLGTITSMPNYDYAEVRLHDDPHGGDVKIPFDFLERRGTLYLGMETNDDSQDNVMDAGAFSDVLPTLMEGMETEESLTKNSPTASVKPQERATDNGIDHDSQIEIFSDEDNDDKPSPNDQLRTLTSYEFVDDLYGQEVPHVDEDASHYADATGADEQDNPSEDQPAAMSTVGPENEGTVTEEDRTASTHLASGLEWLAESNNQSGSSFDGFDPKTIEHITKHSAKNYRILEQVALIVEDGVSDKVDHLNLTNSFYEEEY